MIGKRKNEVCLIWRLSGRELEFIPMPSFLSSKGCLRLAVAISVVWLLLLYFLTESDQMTRYFLLFGLLPVIAGWMLLWVRSGFSKDKEKSNKRFKWPWRS